MNMEPIDDYVIIKKSLLEEKLKYAISRTNNSEQPRIRACYMQEKIVLEHILEQSKPLKPIVEDAFDKGWNEMYDYSIACDFTQEQKSESKENYLTNLTI